MNKVTLFLTTLAIGMFALALGGRFYVFFTTLAIGMLLGAFAVSVWLVDQSQHDQPADRRHYSAICVMERQAARLAKYKRWLAGTFAFCGCMVVYELWRVWQ